MTESPKKGYALRHKHVFDWWVKGNGKKVIECVHCGRSLDDIIFQLQYKDKD